MVQLGKIKDMKKYIKTVMFQIGVDCLGFPLFHKHLLVFKESSNKIFKNNNIKNWRHFFVISKI